jgi:hypothetical protein
MGTLAATMVRIEGVTSGQRRFVFNYPLDVEIYSEDGAWMLEHPAVGLHSHGLTFEAAMENFAEDVAYCWDAYAIADDAELADQALATKASLLQLVKRIDAACPAALLPR